MSNRRYQFTNLLIGVYVIAVMIRKVFGMLQGRDGDCVETRKNASAYLDGDLPASRMERMRRHLASCGPCRNFVDTLTSTMRVLRAMPRHEATQSLKNSILEKAREAEKRKERN